MATSDPQFRKNVGGNDNTEAYTEPRESIREITTTIISGAIVATTLYILVNTYYSGSAANFNAEAFQRQKDILLLSLGFLGTVTGYYLGRVPAERQADAARRQADVANVASRKAEQGQREAESNVEATKRMVRDQLDKIEDEQADTRGGGGGSDPVIAAIRNLKARL